jgi:hypothetical protein
MPIWTSKTGKAREYIAKQYMKNIAIMGSIYGAAEMAGVEIEYDPRSSKFGEIKVGNVQVNPLNYLKPWIVFLARLPGKTKNYKGEIENLRWRSDEKSRYKGYDSLLMDFMRTKLAPSAGVTHDVAAGKQFGKNEEADMMYVAESLLPLTLRQMPELYDATDPISGTLWNVANIHGLPVRETYENMKERENTKEHVRGN